MTKLGQELDLAERAHESAEFKTLMASVGYLMFYWTLLDRAVLAEIKHLRTFEGETVGTSKARGTFSERLAEWQALASQRSRRNVQAGNMLRDLASQAERLNRKRKLIAQHFTGASQNGGDGGLAIHFSEAGIIAPEAAHSRLTQADLDALIEEVRRCRNDIEGLRKLL